MDSGIYDSEPFLFGPGVYDPQGAELAMYYGFKAVYFSGSSFAIGHLGTTDMDMYANVEIADAARRTVSALRKFQLTMAVGDPEKAIPPKHLHIPPVIVDMDGGYGNIFNVQRTTELYVNAGVAAAHIEDQVLPKRCGHIGGKALIPVNEMVGKLRMARAVADDCGNEDFVLIARTDGLSAVDAPESQRGIELQKKEWEKGGDFPTRSHHFFSGVPYHHVVGKMYDAARLGKEFCEELPEEKVV